MFRILFYFFIAVTVLIYKSCNASDTEHLFREHKESMKDNDSNIGYNFLNLFFSFNISEDKTVKYLQQNILSNLPSNPIYKELIAFNGDVSNLVNIINRATKYKILQIEGEQIKLDAYQLTSYIQNNIGKITQQMFPRSHLLQFVVQNEINRGLNSHFLVWKAHIEEESLPVNVVERILKDNSHVRQKRDYETSIIQTVVKLAFSMVRGALSRISTVIKKSTDQLFIRIINFLISLVTSIQPENGIQDVVAILKNTFIEEIVKVLINTQRTIDNVFQNAIQQNRFQSRRKRSNVNEIFITGDTSVSSSRSIISLILSPFKLLFDIVKRLFNMIISIVTHPLNAISSVFSGVLSIFKFIFDRLVASIGSLFNSFVSVINCTLKRVVVLILDKLESLLHSLLVEPVMRTIFNMIDSIIPCSTQCKLNLVT